MVGRFITLEGIDGAGKSTQARLLSTKLNTLKHENILTREPGGSRGGEDIRNLLIKGSTNRWSAKSEILLFSAARCDHVEKVILPTLKKGISVICDRFIDSTYAYQGYIYQELQQFIDIINDKIIAIKPDLTFIIDVMPQLGLSRCLKRNSDITRFENIGLDFQKKARAVFLNRAQRAPQRCVVIDGNQSAKKVHMDIFQYINKEWYEYETIS